MNRIIGRQRELQLLNDGLLNDKRRPGQLAFLYGRHQVGKTALLLHWAQQAGRPYFYWVPPEGTPEEIEGNLVQSLVDWAHLDPALKFLPGPFCHGPIQTAILRAAAERPIILIFDEFHRTDEAWPALACQLQQLEDFKLEETAATIILVGSDFGTALQVLGYDAPLYDRCWIQYRLDPLPFATLSDFFPHYTTVERLGVYAILGGIPGYLEQFDPEQSLETNIRKHFFPPTAMFLNESAAVIEGLKNKASDYEVVLRALARGYQSRVQLTRVTGIPKKELLNRLFWLKRWHLVEHCLPVMTPPNRETRFENQGRGRFYLRDPYLHFYFRFIEPNLNKMEQGQIEAVWRSFKRQFWSFVGKTAFQELCREWIWKLIGTPELPFCPERVGFCWDPKIPIDLAAIDWRKKVILLGICWWKTQAVDLAIVRDIVAKVSLVVPNEEWQTHYVIFSRAGFTGAACAEAELLRLELVDLESIET